MNISKWAEHTKALIGWLWVKLNKAKKKWFYLCIVRRTHVMKWRRQKRITLKKKVDGNITFKWKRSQAKNYNYAFLVVVVVILVVLAHSSSHHPLWFSVEALEVCMSNNFNAYVLGVWYAWECIIFDYLCSYGKYGLWKLVDWFLWDLW